MGGGGIAWIVLAPDTGQMVGCSGFSNELLGSITCLEFPDQLNIC